MQLRRPVRLLAAAGLLVLAAPTLTSCGFDYATDRVYTPGAGTNDRDARVDVLSAVVVSAQDGSGTLVASFANNDDMTATVEDVAGAGDDASLKVKGFSTIHIPPRGLVNLADAETPIVITGDYETGAFLTLKFSFGDGTSVQMDVPTVRDCYEYSGLDKSAETGTPASECQPEAPDTEN